MTRFYWGIAILLTIGVFVVSLVLYPQLPERIPTHWNIRGEIDGYGKKTWAVFLMPAAMVVMMGVFAILPWLSPKPFTLNSFRTTYYFIVMLVLGLFAYIHVLTLFAAHNRAFDFPRTMLGGMFLFFALLGNVLGKVKRNFYVGIRVPWTLASERVWNETHRLAAWLMVGAGLLGFLMVVFKAPILIPCVILGVAFIVPIVYSFVLSKRLEASGETEPDKVTA
jgi:uncharacterized membrane protein